MALATKPYILWLDADDVVDPGEREKLIALKERLDGRIDAVMMPYHYAFADDGSLLLAFERERIVRRGAGFSFDGAVHEAMRVQGHVIRENVIIRHTGRHGENSNRRNLAIYEAQIAAGKGLSPRDRYYYARELRSAGELERAAEEFEGFLSQDGWPPNRIDAQIQLGDCLMQLGRPIQARRVYLASLEMGEPRAEALCALGKSFLDEGDLRAAAHWYRAALLCLPPQDGSFVSVPAYGYVPLMQLCVILWRMGDEAAAARMNERALLIRPGDAAALRNRAYFAARLQKDRQNQEKRRWEE